MKRTWSSEEIKELYNQDPRLHYNHIDFTPWARLVYLNDGEKPYKTLRINTKNERNRREIVMGILYAILVCRFKWCSILTYYSSATEWLSFVKEKPYPVYLESLTSEIKAAFIAQASNPTQAKHRRNFLMKMHTYLTIFLSEKPIMERDIWPLDYFALSPERIRSNTSIRTINFAEVTNDRNRWLLKKYILEIICHSNLALSTIVGRLGVMKYFFKWWGDRPIDVFSQYDLEKYAEYADKGQRRSSFNMLIYTLRDFFSKGIQLGIWLSHPVFYEQVLKKFRYCIRFKGASSKALTELFSRIDKLPHLISSLLLLIYYSGIRISEAVNMRIDGMHRLPDTDTKYIKVYQFKMRKYVITPIPQHLYEVLLRQREIVLKQNPWEHYLFPSKPGMPVTHSYLGQYLNRFCKKEKIIDEDGNIYHFRAHEFRHSYAIRLIHNDVPFLTIQRLLHHDSPEMTLIYAQLDEETRKKRYLEFCEKNEAVRTKMSPDEREIDDNMIWLRHQISQTLPNGYCGYPIKLGACPRANACLFCDKFFTTPEFLPVLEYQLAKTFKLLEIQKSVETNRLIERTRQRLSQLIQELKEGKKNVVTGMCKCID